MATEKVLETNQQEQYPKGRSSPRPRKLSVRRKWCFRLISMTVIPALFLGVLELLLLTIGFGYPSNFFLKSTIAGKQVYVENLDFGRRFFPQGLERAPLPLVVQAEKAPKTFRVFVFGESAAMGFPGSSFSFSRILEVMLQDRFPNTNFELINTSVTAINSHVILPIARECASLKPDLFIVYMGNNEVVGPFGASGVLGPASENLGLLRASLFAKKSRTAQAVEGLMQFASGGKAKSPDWNGMAMFMDHQVRHNDPRLKSVYSHFGQNLSDICQAGLSTGANVIVCTVASNLRDSPPFDSLPSLEFSREVDSKWATLFQVGAKFETVLNYAAAAESYNQALKIDSDPADLHFRLARCLLAMNQVSEARKHFKLARDRDTLRFRADSEINREIRAVAGQLKSQRIHLADIERAIELASDMELPGNEFFYEHVHFNFAGNYVVAHEVFGQIEQLIATHTNSSLVVTEPLSCEECKKRLAFTDWNEMNSLGAVSTLFANVPFTNQIDNNKQQTRVQQQLHRIQRGFAAEGPSEPVDAYLSALKRSENDFVLHMDFGLLLMSLKKYEEALEHFLIVQKHLPYHPAPHVLIANAFAAQGKYDDALFHCAAALRLKPGWPQAIELQKNIGLTRKGTRQ